jgi:hypothetical protein
MISVYYFPQTGKLPALLEGCAGDDQFLTGQIVFASGSCEKKDRGDLPGNLWQVMNMALERLRTGFQRLFKKEPKL